MQGQLATELWDLPTSASAVLGLQVHTITPSFCVVSFWDRVSLHNPGCLGTCCVDHTGIPLTEMCPSLAPECVSTPELHQCFYVGSGIKPQVLKLAQKYFIPTPDFWVSCTITGILSPFWLLLSCSVNQAFWVHIPSRAPVGFREEGLPLKNPKTVCLHHFISSISKIKCLKNAFPRTDLAHWDTMPVLLKPTYFMIY